MSKVLPQPPAALALSPVATLSAAEAVAWLADELGVHGITERFIKSETERGHLAAQIIAGRRRYSTQSLYAWIVTRPASTRRGRKNT